MKGCDHQKIFSGRTNLERKFEWICSRCGEMGWDHFYVMAQVNADEFYRQRVIHGWAIETPRVPVVVAPSERRFYRNGCLFFAGLFVVLALLGHTALPLWAVLVGMGAALLNATLLFICWRGQWLVEKKGTRWF